MNLISVHSFKLDKFALEAIIKSTDVFVRCIAILLKKLKKEGQVERDDFLKLLEKINSRGFDWEFLKCIYTLLLFH